MRREAGYHLLRYGVALLLVVLAVLLRPFFERLVGDAAPFVLLFGVVLVAASYAGLGPGLVATTLSALTADYLYFDPRSGFSTSSGTFGQHLRLVLFLFEGAVICFLVESLRRLRFQALSLSEAKNQALDRERLAQGAALAAEQHYRDLVNSLDAIVWEADPNTLRFTFVSDRAETLLGYPSADWISNPNMLSNLVHPEDRQSILESRLSAAATGKDHNLEYRAISANGETVWLRDMAYVARSGADRVLRGFMIDITQRKRAEDALRESETRFRQLADSMPQMVWTTRPDGVMEYVNQQWRAFTGLTLAEANNRPSLARIIHPDDIPAAFTEWDKALASGSPYQQQFRLEGAADGEYRWFLGRMVPIRDVRGRIVRWFGTATDIDDQKRTEETLKEADRRKDEFLAILSHELRNPLAPIRNALHLFRMSHLSDPELVEARNMMERQVQLLAGIVDDLLDVFRITHHKIALRKEPLDLVQLIRVTIADHRSAFEGSQRTVVLELPQDPVWVQGDQTRLAQVVTNLLNNAAKFTNPGDRITVGLAVTERVPQVIVSIRDTGVGIPPDVLPHVFDTFAQGEQSIDRGGGGGLGLGLALVKGIVELHGGRVRASSPGPGRGAEIAFWLPLSKKPKVVPLGNGLKRPLTKVKPLRILIIEDNRDAAKTLCLLLGRYGHEVTTAHSGREGVEKAQSWRPDVVLCDLGLPEMDGYEVAAALRQDPDTSALRLIALSGYGQEEDRRKSEAAGFDLHLTKPVDPIELQRLLAVIKVGA